MRLSDAFCKPTDTPELEVVCRVLNVNRGCQGELKKKSRILYGYSFFMEKVRENQASGENLDDAVRHAIKVCMEEHILEDFFKTRGDEVRKVMQFDMRWERREQLIREEEREEARKEARREGREELIAKLQRKVRRGKTLAEMADDLEETEDAIRPVYEAIKEKGVDCPPAEIYEYLNEKL